MKADEEQLRDEIKSAKSDHANKLAELQAQIEALTASKHDSEVQLTNNQEALNSLEYKKLSLESDIKMLKKSIDEMTLTSTNMDHENKSQIKMYD